ncbi:hypothetical protein [Comamonas flocculans]|uniref:DUF2782 domain-containing protein n=1 Tax=Comamonas flocculans TaxID=2597701 RepID=A0A5B8RRP3_9BURK|nr:hypothetical protein [Comamonas flocculans]QEA12240.1 hypothetical protein FOZ74_03865 [Comamonas flocculans]
MRAPLLLALASLVSTGVLAQANSQNTAQPLPAERQALSQEEQAGIDQGRRVQRIVIEDEGSRVDELRVGGETRSITVQPKLGGELPSYQVRPSDGARLWKLGTF